MEEILGMYFLLWELRCIKSTPTLKVGILFKLLGHSSCQLGSPWAPAPFFD